MTHQQWQQELKAALDLASRDKVDAARRLERLAARCARASKAAVGDWQFEQSLTLAAATLQEAGRHKDAARIHRRLSKHHASSLAYQGRGLASAQTAVALALFAAGKPSEATRAGLAALKWAGQFPDPNVLLEKLLRELRAAMTSAAQRRVRKSRRRRRV
jgi:hypothetical protein